MKWTYARVPDCFHCRLFIGWPYCRFYKDGIPWDIQSGANAHCPQYEPTPELPGFIKRLRDLLHHAQDPRTRKH